MAEMKKDMIATLVGEAIHSSINYDGTELTEKRQQALNYYFGKMPDVPAAPGGSSIISKDVATIVGWMIPGIIKTFTGSGRMVDFMPQNQNDEEFTDQASDTINHYFMKDNEGYRILYNAVHDALLFGDGIIKVWWDTSPEYETSFYSNLDENTMALLLQDPEVEVLAHTQGTMIDENSQEIPTHELKIKRVTKSGSLKFASVEPENFLMDKEWPTIDESRFVAQRDLYTKSQLVEMGYDRGMVESLPSDRVHSLMEEDLERDQESFNITDSTHESVQLVEVFECYIKLDVDDDGIAETVKAIYAGNDGQGELLEYEVWDDDYPFVAIPCEPIPHRFDSQSAFDWTADLQRIKTTLNRQLMDNVYANNNPQPQFEAGSVLNPESVTNAKRGQPILRKKGSMPVEWFMTPFIADKTLAAIQSVDAELERRTGISRESMALDPDTLQNQTATAANLQHDARQSKVDLVARNMAELGFRTLFRKALRLTVKHQDRPSTIRLRQEWVPVDPRFWNADMDCTVNTGLGTGSRERDVAALTQIFGLQDKIQTDFAEAGFMEQAIEYIPKMNQVAVKIGENTGLRNADDYFLKVDEKQKQALNMKSKQQQEEPSEIQQKLQAEQGLEKARMEMDMQKFQMEHQGKMALEEAKLQQTTHREKSQMEADITVKTTEAQLLAVHQEKELEVRREKDLRDYEIDLAKIDIEYKKMGMQQDQAQSGTLIEVQRINQQAQSEDKRIAAQKEIANAKSAKEGTPSEGS